MIQSGKRRKTNDGQSVAVKRGARRLRKDESKDTDESTEQALYHLPPLVQLAPKPPDAAPPTLPGVIRLLHAENSVDAYYLNGQELRLYNSLGQLFRMQKPENENHSEIRRVTTGGQHLCYQLQIAQQPERARACGAGPRANTDRRPVDPPPVARLKVLDVTNQHQPVDVTAVYESNFMLFASLEHARPINRGTVWSSPHTPVLTGTCVAGAAYLSKPETAAYFIFSDLSVRHEGWYRIKFHLFEQVRNSEDSDVSQRHDSAATKADGDSFSPEETMVNRSYVLSSPFQVFSAKKFPGLEPSTQLSRSIADQGCRIRIRRDVRQRKPVEKKDDGERQLRDISAEPGQDAGSLSHWAIGYADETRRPSENHNPSQGHATSRNPSMSTNTTAVTSFAEPPQPHPASQSSYLASPVGSVVAEPANMYTQRPMPPPQQMRPLPPHRPSYPSMQSPGIQQLPGIASFTTPSPTLPQAPIGGYALPAPLAKKRTLGRSSEEPTTLKNGARPSRSPVVPYGQAILDWTGVNTSGEKAPLAGGATIVTVDDNTDEGDDSDSSDDYCHYKPTYRRANGGRTHIPPQKSMSPWSRGYNHTETTTR